MQSLLLKRSGRTVAVLAAAALIGCVAAIAPAQARVEGSMVDVVRFGDEASESQHAFEADRNEVVQGGLGERARRMLPTEPATWQGGRLSFTAKVDPDRQNYFTVRLWGSDLAQAPLILFCEGKQVGYRHLGDYDLLDIPNGQPSYNGRFVYMTLPIPTNLTKGKSEARIEIRGYGPTYGYAKTFEEYQKPMKDPSRGLYAAYTHTTVGFEPPASEKQGEVPVDPPVRTGPGAEVFDVLKARISKEVTALLEPGRELDQIQMQYLAKAYHVKWTPASRNPELVTRVVANADRYYRNFRKDPTLARSDPKQANPDWQGLGALGDAVRLLGEPLQAVLDERIDDGAGAEVTRRDAWSKMLQASRDIHLRARPQYTNQCMIVDMNTYMANRGVAAIDPANAMPEEKILPYLYQAIGIDPWLGNDTDNGPAKPLGDSYYQLTRKGLTKELGYVGYYGEVLDWVTHIFNATGQPGKPGTGDPKIKEQLIKMQKARSYFRYPALDENGNRAMRMEAIVGWRDAGHYPAEVTYGERSAWEGSATYASAATLDPHAVGADQQMFADNQFFASVEGLVKQGGYRVSNTLVVIPDQYELLQAQPPSEHRLPMTPGQPDFAWADEEDGVLALKNGDEMLYASLYWRARYGINNLARVHHITPRFDRVAIVCQETQFEPSGKEYKRPNWVNFGFGNGGMKFPAEIQSAHTGEVLQIPKQAIVGKFKVGDESPYAGRGDFYRLQYGRYLIGMNCTPDKTFDLQVPAGVSSAPELVSRKTVTIAGPLKVGPMSTVVLDLATR